MPYRFFILLLSGIWPVVGVAADNAQVRAFIQERVEQIETSKQFRLQNRLIASEIVLPALYRKRNYRPVWQNRQSINQLLDNLKSLESDGLNAGDYHYDELISLQERLWETGGTDDTLAADYDLLLTDSLIRLGYHLQIGKVDPVELDSQWNMNTKISSLEMVLGLAKAIEIGRVDKMVESLRPQFHIYANLKAALARYRLLASNGGWMPIGAGSTLRPGMIDRRVLEIRRRLQVTGELSQNEIASIEYNDALMEAVKKFQYRHGLKQDGVSGKETIDTMNIPVEIKIAKIKVNLERARWVLHDLPDEFVLADIAGFSVNYYRDGKVIWSTRAQVGRPYRKTPVFRSQIRYLVINPTWTVPPTILEEDILPEIQKDITYLQKKRLHILDFNGQPVDENSIDWTLYPEKKFPYMIRQDSGPHGALGRVKFMFPNQYSVYLHDTPYRSLFDNSTRAFSSGCIRIEKPYELAELLLKDPVNWSYSRINSTIESLQTISVSLPEPVTLILFYWTASVDQNGKVLFKPDIYNRDQAILSRLGSHFRFREKPVFEPVTPSNEQEISNN